MALALIVWQRPNVLILDEPTNHLDLDMRHALSMALQDFEGAVVLVSHERQLIASVCDELLLVHGGKCTEFEGDLQDYAKWLREARQQQINAQTAVAQNNSSSAAQLPLKSIKRHSVKKQLAVVNKLAQSVKILKRLNLKLKSFSHVLLKSKKL